MFINVHKNPVLQRKIKNIIILKDGKNSRTVTLNKPNKGLLIVPGIWRELENFSSGAVCLVLASEVYDEADYIRDFETFKKQFS